VDPEVERLLERRSRVPEAREDKRRSLSEAIAEHVRSGDALHLGLTHCRGSAAWYEIVRQFHGSDPRFTLLAVQTTSPMAPLVHAGLVQKVITSWAGDSYWTPGPNGVYQRAHAAGVEFEMWSILTVPQRLAAAARGLPWTTTRSLIGSDMARDNAPNAFREVEPGLAMISALVPDVSVYHAAAADAAGNVLVTPPLMENVYGALAARRGAIVTVERILEPDALRAHSAFARIPSGSVLAVVEAPVGGHPGGLFTRSVAGVEPYGEDYEFWVDIRRASKDPAAMDAWTKEWVLEPRSHAEYVERLGPERLERLRARSVWENWRAEIDSALPGVDLDERYNALEMAMVAGGREIASTIEENGYRAVLAGAGMANLAAWLAAFALADRGIKVDLAAEMGLVGYWPAPGEPHLFNQRNFPTCTMLADIDFTLSILIGGAHGRAVGSLGAAQVDKHGDINSTMSGSTFLMGSGGANDVATCAAETVVTVAQSRQRMPERVDYVTAPGDRVRTVLSTLGVYRKDGDELVLTAVYGDDVVLAVKEARETCGWDLRVARSVRGVEPPTREELRTLRLMDPHGLYRR
jgi:acyl CoA:acetate/3-ketoacid CoA transferase alpha subunit/acyl CoA:acetate/3-ketoacid CoA transferase beta subunit